MSIVSSFLQRPNMPKKKNKNKNKSFTNQVASRKTRPETRLNRNASWVCSFYILTLPDTALPKFEHKQEFEVGAH